LKGLIEWISSIGPFIPFIKNVKALLMSETKYRMLFENIPLAYQSLDAEGRLLEVNPAWQDLLGYLQEDVIGRWFGDFLAPAHQEKFNEDFALFKEAGRTRIEYEMVRKDSDHIVVLCIGSLSFDTQGNFKQTHCILQDITERKQIEAEIEQLKLLYESILEGIVTGVWVTNEEDVIVYTNKGMAAIAGISREQIQGIHVLMDFPESTLQYLKPLYVEAKNTLRPVKYDAIPVVTPAGRQSYQSGWLIPRIKNDNDYNGIICTVEDITEKKQAEELLERQKDELSEFVHAMAHDLRNSLFSIAGYADTITHENDPSYAEKIYQIVQVMGMTLERSVALADAGLVIEKLTEVNLTSLIREIAGRIIPDNIIFSLNELCTVSGDLEKLTQIFQNLFENAVTHGRPKTIEMAKQISDEGVSILISNDGARIPSEDRSKVFQQGFTTKKNGKGLGLTIVEKVVKAHGWEISLDNTPKTTFRIFIPSS
jgi:PAS domain S-box-containing protein